MAYLSKILIYPIKSLDGVEVTTASLLECGALAHDREFALFDQQSKVVNGKRTPLIHAIRSSFDVSARTVTLWTEAKDPQTFDLEGDRSDLEGWFSDYFGYRVMVQQNSQGGFPDDTEAAGPTVVSVATLEAIASWFDLPLAEVRRRFRTNLEIADVPAFWEDHLFAESGEKVSFQIGEVTLMSSNACQRCIVPTRDSQTGESLANFQKTFIVKRRETLPERVVATQFNHFYKLTINTQLPGSEAGKGLYLKDRICVE